jgi:UDP-N-acetylglucosamine--N-acetylmuramyl-(pentapeptide) pyrophosphoryl-undecaprenol N-acetylglucosamine transferase
VICAAAIKKTPLVLFESNAIPGKVIRFFSKRAKLTGIYFSEAKNYLGGKTVEVEIPVKRPLFGSPLSKEQARAQLLLDPHLLTLLVFGGSQGAKGINRNLPSLLPLLTQVNLCFQLIHLTGCEQTALEVSQLCHSLSIPCYVKKFEKDMAIVWGAADIAICRSGAMTLSELLHHEVPGILIPYPEASDQHQLKNARFLEKTVGGAVCIEESSLTPQTLGLALLPLVASGSPRRDEMKAAMRNFKAQQKKADLARLITQLLY